MGSCNSLYSLVLQLHSLEKDRKGFLIFENTVKLINLCRTCPCPVNLSSARTYGRGPRFFSWAYRICVNLVTDQIRLQKRRHDLAQACIDPMETRAATPEEELISRQLMDRTRSALQSMPLGQRAVFVLARVEGLSYTEISDLLSIPVGTVKSRIFGAVRTLMANGMTP